MSTTEKELCFIITPIGEDNAPIRRHIDGIIDAAIIPALGEKYDVKAAHHTKHPGTITKQVIEAIYNAKLVIANLTERNPNVMYELALRHAIGKPAIMIVERGTPIPSDIIMQRTIPYYNDAKGVLELQEELKNAESEIDFEAKSGPIFEVLGDITRDTNMLKEAAESKAGSQEPLAYIMQRLDRIESSLHRQETGVQMAVTSVRTNEASDPPTIVFSFDRINPAKYSRAASNRIQDRLRDMNCELVGFDLTPDEMYVIVSIPPTRALHRIVNSLRNELIGLGFTGIGVTIKH